MVLVIHIITALLSLVLSGLSLISPGQKKLTMSYWLVSLTLITGTFLVVSKPTHLTQSCFEGLVYLGFIGGLIFAAQRKLIKSDLEAHVKQIGLIKQ